MSTPDHRAESPRPSAALSAGARGIPDKTLPPGEWQVCPRCGDPLTTGCRPAAGICVVDPIEDGTHLIAPGTSALTDAEYAAQALAYGRGRDDEAAGNDIPAEYATTPCQCSDHVEPHTHPTPGAPGAPIATEGDL